MFVGFSWDLFNTFFFRVDLAKAINEEEINKEFLKAAGGTTKAMNIKAVNLKSNDYSLKLPMVISSNNVAPEDTTKLNPVTNEERDDNDNSKEHESTKFVQRNFSKSEDDFDSNEVIESEENLPFNGEPNLSSEFVNEQENSSFFCDCGIYEKKEDCIATKTVNYLEKHKDIPK